MRMAPHTPCDMPTIHIPCRAPHTHANLTSHIQMRTQTARLHCGMALCWPRTLCAACMPHHSQHISHMDSSTHLLRHAYESHAMPCTTRTHWTATSHLRMTAPPHAQCPAYSHTCLAIATVSTHRMRMAAHTSWDMPTTHIPYHVPHVHDIVNP